MVCGVGYFLLSSMCPQRLLVAGCPLTLLLVAVAVMTCLIVPVARLTYVVNQAEGSYRFLHARIKVSKWAGVKYAVYVCMVTLQGTILTVVDCAGVFGGSHAVRRPDSGTTELVTPLLVPLLAVPRSVSPPSAC